MYNRHNIWIYVKNTYCIYSICLPKGLNSEKVFFTKKNNFANNLQILWRFQTPTSQKHSEMALKLNSRSDSISITALIWQHHSMTDRKSTRLNSTTVWQRDSISPYIYLLIFSVSFFVGASLFNPLSLSSSLFSFYSPLFTLIFLLP